MSNLRTDKEVALAGFAEYSKSMRTTLDEIEKTIKAGKPISREAHVDAIKLFSQNLVNELTELALPKGVMYTEEDAKSDDRRDMQESINAILEDYVDENELNPALLEPGEDGTEPFTMTLWEDRAVTLRGRACFDIPLALLENHREEILQKIKDEFFPQPFEDLVDMEDRSSGDLSDYGIDIE